MDEMYAKLTIEGNINNSKRELDDQLFKITNEEQDLILIEKEIQLKKEFNTWRRERLKILDPKQQFEADTDYADWRKKFQEIADEKDLRQLEGQKRQIQKSINASKEQVNSLNKQILELEKKLKGD